MHKINVSLNNNTYDILIAQGIEKSIENIISNLGSYNKVFIITQQSIINIYKFSKLLLCGYDILIVNEGESAKKIKETEKTINQLINNGCTRDSLIIGFGGGSVTDLTGFIASVFMRGIDHIFIPTNLLGMVDASIGGKTGLNTDIGRNVIGTIKQPKAVFIDPLYLKTLSTNDIINGCAEIIKYGLICDYRLYKKIASEFYDIIQLKSIDVIESIIIKCCKHKKNFIIQDEFDTHERMKLNFGHTVGHAIESYYKYKDISHGEAVYYGMIAASYLSNKKGYLSSADFNDINDFITKIPKYNLENININQLLEYIKYDKKILRNKQQFILLNNIGDAFIADIITANDIKESIKFLLN